MTDDDRVSIIAHTTLAQLEMQGMIAANQERESLGQNQAYGEYAFAGIRQELREKLAQHMVIV